MQLLVKESNNCKTTTIKKFKTRSWGASCNFYILLCLISALCKKSIHFWDQFFTAQLPICYQGHGKLKSCTGIASFKPCNNTYVFWFRTLVRCVYTTLVALPDIIDSFVMFFAGLIKIFPNVGRVTAIAPIINTCPGQKRGSSICARDGRGLVTGISHDVMVFNVKSY